MRLSPYVINPLLPVRSLQRVASSALHSHSTSRIRKMATSVVTAAASTEKRDILIQTEKRYQDAWRADRLFETDAPSCHDIPYGSLSSDELHARFPKYYGTMAFPYLNGTMHAGHAFTASKIEFAVGFARMQGQRTLFPIGFHCTGMPIRACADKLANEIELFGPQFEHYTPDEVEESARDHPIPTASRATREDATKFVSKKSKTASKTPSLKYQFQIMLALGIPQDAISKFADPAHWLEHFPPVVIKDLNNFGARIDWRRQFVTTEANLYYDSFVRWQMNRLRALKKILYGHRYTVYSPKDGQPCMDHDRTEGEGVIPQEHTVIKFELTEMGPSLAAWLDGKVDPSSKVFFIAATLRPETIYGVTSIFAGPTIEYGLYRVDCNTYYVVTPRAAWNMAFQGHFFSSNALPRQETELKPLAKTLGSTFIGSVVRAPYTMHNAGLRILPMDNILPSKGTGLVMCVPSDSPDDCITLRDLRKKPQHYGINEEWAGLDAIPIIETESYGNMIAPALIESMKINSPRDVAPLAAAKAIAYKEGHFKGKMLVGEFAGEAVSTAKSRIRDLLIAEALAFPYAEPDGVVVSRSGDHCVVAYMGQWFLNYGAEDPKWQQAVTEYVTEHLEAFAPETKHNILATVEWLNRWACARSYGLGSKLPWDDAFVVESLSDSTIYHAYYTVAHLLHSDRFGHVPGPMGVLPEQMTDIVWDTVFGLRPIDQKSQSSGIALKHLQAMRREFEYWYPLDLSVTGKDLVPNHVTFSLYVHQAIFPTKHLPRAVRSNGHLLLNSKKMSKSTGNFLTLNDAVEKYGADATRIAMADAGDTGEDASFEESVANSTILRLHAVRQWAEEAIADKEMRDGPLTIWDRLFENELRALVYRSEEFYKLTQFRMALRSGFYDFIAARDFYREVTRAAGIGMHASMIRTYLELQALVVAPIAPHWSEYIWLNILHKNSSIQTARWPHVDAESAELTASLDYIRTIISRINSMKALQQKKKAKGKDIAFDSNQPMAIKIIVAAEYPKWQSDAINAIHAAWSPDTRTLDDTQFNMAMMGLEAPKSSRPFLQLMKKRLLSGEPLDKITKRGLVFDEFSVANQCVEVIRLLTGFDKAEAGSLSDWQKTSVPESGILNAAIPGHPGLFMEQLA